jgi:pimeloyl-ACP methyl ester carboxylesterase
MTRNERERHAPPDLMVAARAPLAVWRRGAGDEAVLLLHGYPDHAVSMLPLAHHLAAHGFLAVTVALPGFAPSAPVEECSADAICADLLSVLDELRIERSHVIGHDWGAAFAYHLACHHAERIGRVVALSVPHPHGFRTRRATLREQRTLTYALRLADPMLGPAIARDRRWVTSLASAWSPGLYRRDWPLVLDTVCGDEGAEQTHRYYRDDLAGRGRSTGMVRRATTVIHGAQDGCISPAVFHGLEHLFAAGLTEHVLADVGHWPHLERADAVHAIVLDALGA